MNTCYRSAEVLGDIYPVIGSDRDPDPRTIVGRGQDILTMPGAVHPATDRGLCNLLRGVPGILCLTVAVVGAEE